MLMTGNDGTIASDQAFWDGVLASKDRPAPGHERFSDEDREVADALDHLLRYRGALGGPEFRPPVALSRRMASLFGAVRPDLVVRTPAQATVMDRVTNAVRRVIATMVIDTGAVAGGITGLRAASDRRSRQVAFVSDVADLDLELTRPEPDGKPWSVTGQLGMATVPPEQTIWFIPAGHVAMSGALEPTSVDDAIRAPIDRDGYFQVTLDPGDWVGLVEVGDAVVVFREIRV